MKILLKYFKAIGCDNLKCFSPIIYINITKRIYKCYWFNTIPTRFLLQPINWSKIKLISIMIFNQIYTFCFVLQVICFQIIGLAGCDVSVAALTVDVLKKTTKNTQKSLLQRSLPPEPLQIDEEPKIDKNAYMKYGKFHA